MIEAADQPSSFDFAYPLDAPIAEKIRAIATKVYGADGAELLPVAKQKAAAFEEAGLGDLPICMAKTHLSLSHDPALKNAPTGLHRARSRPPPLHRSRLDRRALRRHDDDARAREDAGGVRDRHRRVGRDGRPLLAARLALTR